MLLFTCLLGIIGIFTLATWLDLRDLNRDRARRGLPPASHRW